MRAANRWEEFPASRTSVGLYKGRMAMWVCKCVGFSLSSPSPLLAPPLSSLLHFCQRREVQSRSLLVRTGEMPCPSAPSQRGGACSSEKCSDLPSPLVSEGRGMVLDTASLKPEFGIVLMSPSNRDGAVCQPSSPEPSPALLGGVCAVPVWTGAGGRSGEPPQGLPFLGFLCLLLCQAPCWCLVGMGLVKGKRQLLLLLGECEAV